MSFITRIREPSIALNVVQLDLTGNLPHAEMLQFFLDAEAREFGAKVTPDAIGRLQQAASRRITQISFAMLGDEIVGCTLQSPAVCPTYNNGTHKYDFMSALYNEDFIIRKEHSDHYRALHGHGLGIPLMESQIQAAASCTPTADNIIHGIAAGAFIGEQKQPFGNAPMTKFLRKFGATLVSDPDDCVIIVANTIMPGPLSAPANAKLYQLAYHVPPHTCFARADNRFGLVWEDSDGCERLAAACSLGVKSFSGELCLNIIMLASSLDIPTARDAVSQTLAAARPAVGPEPNFYIQALGQPMIRRALRETTAGQDRRLGNELMHPAHIIFTNIPPHILPIQSVSRRFTPIARLYFPRTSEGPGHLGPSIFAP